MTPALLFQTCCQVRHTRRPASSAPSGSSQQVQQSATWHTFCRQTGEFPRAGQWARWRSDCPKDQYQYSRQRGPLYMKIYCICNCQFWPGEMLPLYRGRGRLHSGCWLSTGGQKPGVYSVFCCLVISRSQNSVVTGTGQSRGCKAAVTAPVKLRGLDH